MQTTVLNIQMPEIRQPVTGVQAAATGPNVSVSWQRPLGPDGWLHYDNGMHYCNIGTGSPSELDLAMRFPVSALQEYSGMSIQALKIWTGTTGEFALRIWKGDTPSAPDSLIYEQTFSPVNDYFCEIELPVPLPIDTAHELWLGYHCNVVSGYPAGCDSGPARDGFGNLVNYRGVWSSLKTLQPELDFNWNLSAYIVLADSRLAPEITPWESGNLALNSLKSKFNRTTLKEQSEPRETADSRSWIGYKVWRLHLGQETNDDSWALITPNPITELNLIDTAWSNLPYSRYRWAVKAIYSGGLMSAAAFSNVIIYVQPVGTLTGFVHDLQNQPIQGATITCNGASASTNPIGEYMMPVLSGVWSVTASHPDYLPVTNDNITVATGQTTPVNFQLSPSAIEDPHQIPVVATELMANYPNPFNPATTIAFSIKDACPVILTIYNLQGKAIKELLQGSLEPGKYSLVWDGTDRNGAGVASGVYYYKMIAGKYSSTRKMILLK